MGRNALSREHSKSSRRRNREFHGQPPKVARIVPPRLTGVNFGLRRLVAGAFVSTASFC
jgi:hypothetical protein